MTLDGQADHRQRPRRRRHPARNDGEGAGRRQGRPCEAAEFNTHTGFYVRKYNDTKVGSGDEKTGSEVWFIRYRFGEVLLNAAEAAFELDQKDLAAQYLTRLRERAASPRR